MTRGSSKLLEILASGLGAIAAPLLAPWKAEREGAARIVEAQADAKITAIRAEAHVNAREIVLKDLPATSREIEISDRVNERIRYQEEKRLANIESVVERAASELEDKEVPNTEPDHDWAARFFNEVQDISSEEMQVLWAKVLAGEVERPGSTSVRTLGLLKDLDRNTAQLFTKFCSACIFLTPEAGRNALDARVSNLGDRAASNSLAAFGFNFDALNHLNEHGLIISDYDSWRNLRFCIVERAQSDPWFPFQHQGREWILVPESNWVPGTETKIEGPSLSLGGRELSKIVEQEPMHEYTKRLQAYFLAKNLRMVQVEEAVDRI